MISTIFFDLDDTLYPASSGLWDAIRNRINRYMKERLGMTGQQIAILREQYFLTYGTTLRGLQVNHNIDPADYLSFVHDIPVGDYLQPNPGLRRMLAGLPCNRIIFTNADTAHADRVVAALGLSGCFQKIIDIQAMTPYCKPDREAFELAVRLAGENDVRVCALVDDQPRTTRAARSLGMTSVLVGSGSRADADHFIDRLEALPTVLAV